MTPEGLDQQREFGGKGPPPWWQPAWRWLRANSVVVSLLLLALSVTGSVLGAYGCYVRQESTLTTVENDTKDNTEAIQNLNDSLTSEIRSLRQNELLPLRGEMNRRFSDVQDNLRSVEGNLLREIIRVIRGVDAEADVNATDADLADEALQPDP